MDHLFGRKDPPASIRRQLASLKQLEQESLEEFAERAQKLALDSYPQVNGDAVGLVQVMAMDAFLWGCTHQRAALQVLNREPVDLAEALRLMITVQNFDTVFAQNRKSVKQVSFEDPYDEYIVRAAEVRAKAVKPLEDRVAGLIEKPLSVAVKAGIEEGMKSIALMLQSILEANKTAPVAATPARPQGSPRWTNSPAGSPARGSCDKCGDTSHYARECTILRPGVGVFAVGTPHILHESVPSSVHHVLSPPTRDL